MPGVVITGTGHYVPPLVVSNDDLAVCCETTDAWIRSRTGIETRRYVAPGQTTSELARHAAEAALADAGRQPAEVDCVIVATLSPDYCFPGVGCLTQAMLGMVGVPAFDVRNQCSGFLYGLQMAASMIRTSTYQRVLLVGAEVHSTGLNFSRAGRDVTVLFGDGAGAVLLEATEDLQRGVIETTVGADGRFAKALWCDGPMSAAYPARITHAMVDEGRQFPMMRGREVFRHAVRTMRDTITALLDRHDLNVDDVRWLIPHQANRRISDMVGQLLSLPSERIFSNIERYGNTTAASIPIALSECVEAGQLDTGDWVVLAAFGSGFTWGAALLRW